MKKIKIKITGHPITDTFGFSYFLLTLLKKYYDVELSEDPDYLFYHESFLDHYTYNCIKIFYTGENVSPDFNTCDYAISFDYLQFEDRHYRFPIYLMTTFFNQAELHAAGDNYLNKKYTFTQENLAEKKEFCSFVYSNYRAEIERKKMFNLLSTYKKVNSAGSYLNNTGGQKIKNKLEYEKQHKFSVAFENSSRSGYTTEKLVSSLVAQTIPIYWGNPNIAKEFNTRRFINCHDYDSFEEVLDKVKELDTNDELYVKTLNEPLGVNDYNYDEVKAGLETFLRNIIDQPLLEAKRATINPVIALSIKNNNMLIERATKRKSILLKIGATLYRPFKRSTFFEELKHSYFSRKKN